MFSKKCKNPYFWTKTTKTKQLTFLFAYFGDFALISHKPVPSGTI